MKSKLSKTPILSKSVLVFFLLVLMQACEKKPHQKDVNGLGVDSDTLIEDQKIPLKLYLPLPNQGFIKPMELKVAKQAQDSDQIVHEVLFQYVQKANQALGFDSVWFDFEFLFIKEDVLFLDIKIPDPSRIGFFQEQVILWALLKNIFEINPKIQKVIFLKNQKEVKTFFELLILPKAVDRDFMIALEHQLQKRYL